MKPLVVLLILISHLRADILYETDFDNFTVGDNQWAGTDGWVSNDTTSGAQAIDSELIPALLNTATLGFNRPASTLTLVALNLDYDHIATGSPLVEIDTILGIEDSSNDIRDDFFLSIYNTAGDRLSSIRFDNQSPDDVDSQFGIWREDGANQFDTLLDFIPGELFNLFVSLDLEKKTWSADVGGNPLFENAQLTNTEHPVDFGFLAFEWDLSTASTNKYGNNFLVVADLIIRSVPVDPTPPFIINHSFDSSRNITLSWRTSVGSSDQVQFSTDLRNWNSSLPDSTFDNITSSSPVTFTDSPNREYPRKYYRVLRTPSNNPPREQRATVKAEIPKLSPHYLSQASFPDRTTSKHTADITPSFSPATTRKIASSRLRASSLALRSTVRSRFNRARKD